MKSSTLHEYDVFFKSIIKTDPTLTLSSDELGWKCIRFIDHSENCDADVHAYL